MLKRLFNILLYAGLFPAMCPAQETDPGPAYQMMMIDNPAFSGAEGTGVLRISYLNFYPGNNYNLHYVYSSYDSYYPALHGGAGVWLSDDYLGGIVNDLRGGLSYAYFLQAGKDFFVHAGLSASFYHRGLNTSGAVLPDQIDPLGGVIYPSSETLASSGRTIFDIGAGLFFISGKVSGGIALNHLAEPDLSPSDITRERLKRKLVMNLSTDIYLTQSHNLKLRPVGFLGLQGGFLSLAGGAVIESNTLSVNMILIENNNRNMNLQTGFSVKAGNISLYYNYRINLLSDNSMLPLSLLHQAGLVFSLNNVDKRNVIKTINFPKM